LYNCIGFIDGTNRRISRPKMDQGIFYSGHKHYHCFKFQSWVTPDGLISHIFGPIPGHRHDLFLWSKSRIEEEIMCLPEFDDFCLFGDQGYHTSGHLLAPVPGMFYCDFRLMRFILFRFIHHIYFRHSLNSRGSHI
jgi:hypothetical protein